MLRLPRAWYSHFASHIMSMGFIGARSDTSLFTYHHGSDVAYLLLYVDDIVLTASSDSLLRRIFAALTSEFSMKDLGSLYHFLCVSVTCRNGGLFLSQRHYMIDMLKLAGMLDCKPCSTSIDTCAKLSSDGPPVADATDYRALVGALRYLTFTRSNICYAIQHICLSCMILVSLISYLSSGLCGMFAILFILGFSYIVLQ